MHKLKDILAELVEENIRQRGYLYFIKGLVENIITSENGVIKNLTKEDIEVLFG